MKLYELTENYKAVIDMADQGVEMEQLTDTLELIKDDIKEKGGNIAALINNWSGNVNAIDAEIKRLTAMKKAEQSRIDRLKDYLRENMEKLEITKIEHPLFKISLGKPSDIVVIDDLDALPDSMKKVVTSADKVKIKAAIKDGCDISGARIESGKSRLLIK